MFNEEYLQALANRDPLVENDLILSFTKPLRKKIRAYFFCREAVEDACQETMLRVFAYFHSGKTLRNPASLPGFIHSVCSKVILEMSRVHKREWERLDLVSVLVDYRSDPEDEMIAHECKQNILRMLGELNNKDRELLWRICLNGEDRNTICERHHITRNYLRLLLYRARTRFKALAGRTKLRKYHRVKGSGISPWRHMPTSTREEQKRTVLSR